MRLESAGKVVIYSYLPVVVSILVMIVLRAQDLANETLNAGLEPGFFNPTTASEAISSGFAIWIPGTFFVAVLAYALYWGMRKYLKATPIEFLATTVVLGLLLAALLYLTKNPFAFEGAFEVLACGIGFGALIPLFYEREYRRELYNG